MPFAATTCHYAWNPGVLFEGVADDGRLEVRGSVRGFGVVGPLLVDVCRRMFRVWPENSIYLKQREITPGVVDSEMIRCQSAWT